MLKPQALSLVTGDEPIGIQIPGITPDDLSRFEKMSDEKGSDLRTEISEAVRERFDR